MRAVSAGYRANMKTGYRMFADVQIVKYGQVQISTNDTLHPHPLVLLEGSVNIDSTAQFRRTCDLTLLSPDGYWRPDHSTDMLAVTSGAEIYIRTGMYVNGAVEAFDQGWFGIVSAGVSDDTNGITLKVTGTDRGRAISRNKVVGAPYIILPNINMTDAVKTLWTARMPTINITVTKPTAHVTTYQALDEQTDPWDIGIQLLASIGYDGYFSPNGTCIIKPIPDINDNTFAVAWEYAEGPDCVVTDLDREQDNTDIFNGQIVTGASTYGLTPARAEVWDTDASSPTYYLGPYGKNPNFTQSDKVAYKAQAVDMANGLLLKSKGLTEVVSFSALPNHAQEEEDLLSLTRVRSGLNQKHMFIDQLTLPLAANGGQKMTIKCRKRTV